MSDVIELHKDISILSSLLGDHKNGMQKQHISYPLRYQGYVETLNLINQIKSYPKKKYTEKFQEIVQKDLWCEEFWFNLIGYLTLIGRAKSAEVVKKQALALGVNVSNYPKKFTNFIVPNPISFVKCKVANLLVDNLSNTVSISYDRRLDLQYFADLMLLHQLVRRQKCAPKEFATLIKFDPSVSSLILNLLVESEDYTNISALLFENRYFCRADCCLMVRHTMRLLISKSELRQCLKIFEEAQTKKLIDSQIQKLAGELYLRLEKFTQASTLFKSLSFADLSINDLNNFAISLWKSDQTKDALKVFKQLSCSQTTLGTTLNYLEFLFSTNHHVEFRKFLQSNTFNESTYIGYYLAQLHILDSQFEGASRQLDKIDRVSLSDNQQIKIYELEHKINHKLGNYDCAFEAVVEMNKTITANYSDSNALKSCFVREFNEVDKFFKHNLSEVELDEKNVPIFIMGFPRSGTTLLDRMLNMHPKISVIEERGILEKTFRDILKNFPPAGTKLNIGQKYSSFLRDEAQSKDQGLIIDKHPLNIRFLPILPLIFADFKVIVVLRNPIEACFSCYRTAFDKNSAMSFMQSQADISKLYELSFNEKCLDLLRDDRVSIVKYEDLIEDPEQTLRKILDFLHLNYVSDLLNFSDPSNLHLTKTPSFNQVNKAVYTTSQGYTINYLDKLETLCKALQPYLQRFDYL